MLPFFSIIVPIFNAELFLSKCIESIVIQSFKDFELILINDGSSDKSELICTQYVKSDDRIRFINKFNSGVSATRNIGIEQARGKYVMFVDADDWIEKDCLRILYKKLQNENLDLLQFSYKRVNKLGEIIQIFSEMTDVLDLNGYLNRGVYLVCAGGSIIKKSVIDNNMIRFRKNLKLGEDQIFILTVMFFSKHIARISDVLYNYYQNSKSASVNPSCADLICSIIEFNNFNYKHIFKFHIEKMIVMQTNLALHVSDCKIFKLYKTIRDIKISLKHSDFNNIDIKLLVLFWNTYSLIFILLLLKIRAVISKS